MRGVCVKSSYKLIFKHIIFVKFYNLQVILLGDRGRGRHMRRGWVVVGCGGGVREQVIWMFLFRFTVRAEDIIATLEVQV